MTSKSYPSALQLATSDLLATATPHQLAGVMRAGLNNHKRGQTSTLEYYDHLACNIVARHTEVRLVTAVGIALDYLSLRLSSRGEASSSVPYCRDIQRRLMLAIAILNIEAENIGNLPVYQDAVNWVIGRLTTSTVGAKRKRAIARAVHKTPCTDAALRNCVGLVLDPRPI